MSDFNGLNEFLNHEVAKGTAQVHLDNEGREIITLQNPGVIQIRREKPGKLRIYAWNTFVVGMFVTSLALSFNLGNEWEKLKQRRKNN